MLAQRHQTLSEIALDLYDRERHSSAAADIRAAIVSADDATKNMLILRAHKAKDRRFSGESITGFDELQEGSS
jgi:hypothetical protein